MHERARAEAMINDIRQMVQNQSPDIPRLRQLSSDLQQLATGLGASSYAQASAGGTNGDGRNSQHGGDTADDVIDAEFQPRS
jgi:hypothetical protein